MATHHLQSSPETVHWGFFDAGLAPVLSVKSGDRVTIDCISGSPDDLPPAPFGVLPEHRPNYGAVTSIIPREYGGNMDLKELVPGTTLYLPVFAEGALFSCGDGHAVQGDGEVCLTALETSLSGTFELILRKDLAVKFPRAE